MASNVQILVFLLLTYAANLLYAAPLSLEDFDSNEMNDTDYGNSTAELYVIRAIVYEVGILTNEDNSTDESEESHERVDLTFYDPDHNGSFIDLSNIPMPMQTNISGQVITGLAPVNLGSLQLPSSNGSDVMFAPAENDSAPFALPNALVSVTTNVSTKNQERGSKILQGLPPLLGLQQQFRPTSESEES